MTMSVVVRKSSPLVVRPPEPLMTRSPIKLTSFDKVFVQCPCTALLVFEQLSHDPTESIKRALSQALAQYYPFSGRIYSGADGDEFHIRCAGEGVEFVTASAGCALEEAKLFDTSPGPRTDLLDELAVYYSTGSYAPSADPLLSIQVTKFSCGGFVLGVTWNHAVADGTGMAQFLGAISELARGLPSPSVIPVRCDDSVSNIPPLFDPILKAMLMHPQDMDMVLVALDITIPSSFINRIKAESRSYFENTNPCTSFEVILAFLWRCRTRAIMSDPGRPAYLSFVTNMRKHVGAKGGYYGNCITDQLVVMPTSGAVANASIMDLIKMIKSAKSQVPDKLKKSESSNQLQGLGGLYDMLRVSSWKNIGFEQVDFGRGAPARMIFHGQAPAPVPTCVVCPSCKGNGVNVLSISVQRAHADAFLQELARHS